MKNVLTSIRLTQGRFRLPLVIAALAVVGLMAVGCSQGAYPLDIFYEMHYQPAYKAHEPPRLTAPASAVPWYGSVPPERTSFAGSGKHIYDTNCAMCHGPDGLGDGPVLGRMLVDYGYQTLDLPTQNPNLKSEAALGLDRTGLKGVITGGVNVMPSFAKLLTDNEIELVLDYVEGCIQDGNAAACQ